MSRNARAERLSTASSAAVSRWSHVRSGVTGASIYARRAMEASCASMAFE